MIDRTCQQAASDRETAQCTASDTQIRRIDHCYYRAHNSGFKAIEGNGLRTAVVRSIGEQYNRQISVTSNSGEGYWFTFTLSFRQNKEAAVLKP